MRARRIELRSIAWEASVLPLNQPPKPAKQQNRLTMSVLIHFSPLAGIGCGNVKIFKSKQETYFVPNMNAKEI